MDTGLLRSEAVTSRNTPRRLLVVDRTRIETTASPEFGLADVLISARTPIRYTMGRHNLARLAASVNAALAELDSRESER